ncbi:MAG TPA: DUF4861 family protein [Bacteroidota bacterium]
MRKPFVLVPLLVLLLYPPDWTPRCVCAPAGSPAARTATVRVTNPADVTRHSETIAVSWDSLGRVLPALTNPPDEALYVTVFDGSAELPSQVMTDPDAPGKKELLFQSDFGARERKSFQVRLAPLESAPSRGSFASPVDAQFVLPREDVAWESDRIAFRIYGSVLAGNVDNGIDVWTKRVRSPIVGKWYKADEGRISGKDYYHLDRGEGADFFSVGRSLGAGGCAPWRNGKLYQPGLFTDHRILATGPVRAAFRVSYDKGTIDGVPFREVMTVSIDRGSNLSRIEVLYSGFPGIDTLTCFAGLVKRNGVTPAWGTTMRRGSSTADGEVTAFCWAGLWGPTNDDPVNGSLGTGVVLAAPAAGRVGNDSTHFGLLITARRGSPLVYYAGAGWTRSGDFATEKDWSTYLETTAVLLKAPLRVEVAP